MKNNRDWEPGNRKKSGKHRSRRIDQVSGITIWRTVEQLSYFRSETDIMLITNRPNQEIWKTGHKVTKWTTENIQHCEEPLRPTTENAEKVLSKSFNYAVVPRHISVDIKICNVEATLQTSPTRGTEYIRQHLARMIRTSKPSRREILKKEETAGYHYLINDTGNFTEQKRLRHKERHHPTRLQEVQQELISREKFSVCLKLYCLTKIRRPNMPLRPIVCEIVNTESSWVPGTSAPNICRNSQIIGEKLLALSGHP